jgi:AraC-like DNA-binding protein
MIDGAAALLDGGIRDMPVTELARLSGRAINHLAADDSRRCGRTPLRPSDWRVIRYSLLSARTLREAIAHCIDCFEAIDWRCGRMSLRSRGEMTGVELDPRRPARSLAGCLIDLSGIASIHALLAWLIGQPLPLRRVAMNQDSATFSALDLPQLPFPLALDQQWTGFEFASAYLDYPVVRTAEEFDARPPGGFLFDTGGAGARGTAADEVRRIALGSLRNARRLPAFDDLVATVGGSAATLRRRLAREGTSYREIKDSCRRELGLDLLRRSNLPIEEIAERLDFCDSDAFRRAFREWLGMPPSRYRQEGR